MNSSKSEAKCHNRFHDFDCETVEEEEEIVCPSQSGTISNLRGSSSTSKMARLEHYHSSPSSSNGNFTLILICLMITLLSGLCEAGSKKDYSQHTTVIAVNNQGGGHPIPVPW